MRLDAYTFLKGIYKLSGTFPKLNGANEKNVKHRVVPK